MMTGAGRHRSLVIECHLILCLITFLLCQSAQAGIQFIQLNIDTPPTFHLERENETRYIIGTTPYTMDESDEPPKGRPLAISSNGIKYQCYLPTTDGDQHDDGSGSHAMSNTATSPNTASIIPSKTPSELIESTGDWCAFRLEDWWTFEFCYKKYAKQYHADIGGKPTQEYILGKYKPTENTLDTVLTDDIAGSTFTKYVKQEYLEGDRCELSELHRQVEVRYVCKESGQPTLLEVREPKSCAYVFIVGIPELCTHAGLKEAPANVKHIQCYPVVGDDTDENSEGVCVGEGDSMTCQRKDGGDDNSDDVKKHR